MAKIVPNDKNCDEILPVENHLKVKAKNEPEIGKEESKNSNMESGEVPSGDARGVIVDK